MTLTLTFTKLHQVSNMAKMFKGCKLQFSFKTFFISLYHHHQFAYNFSRLDLWSASWHIYGCCQIGLVLKLQNYPS
jgi:hypothetical protein